MRKLVLILFLIIVSSCSVNSNIDEDCDDNCVLITGVYIINDRYGNFYRTQINAERLCSKELITYYTGTNRPTVGDVVCRDEF